MRKVIDIIETVEDYPIRDTRYVVGKVEDNQYFFAWGWEYSYADELPEQEDNDGENGFSYFDTKEIALSAMKEAVEARQM